MALLTLDVNVSGGDKLQAHIDGVQGQQFLAAVVRNYRREYRREILPALASRTPKRSGVLARSFSTANARNGGLGFALTSSAPYVNDVRFRDPTRVGARTPGGLANRVFRPKSRGLARRAAALAVRETSQ